MERNDPLYGFKSGSPTQVEKSNSFLVPFHAGGGLQGLKDASGLPNKVPVGPVALVTVLGEGMSVKWMTLPDVSDEIRQNLEAEAKRRVQGNGTSAA